jgi:hypothetical protein
MEHPLERVPFFFMSGGSFMKHAFWAAGAALLALTVTAHAQQSIQWKQVSNLPKGLNQPQGMKLDILGIELGDTYQEVKAKLQKLADEYPAPPKAAGNTANDFMLRQLNQMSGVSDLPPMEEINTIIRYQTPGGQITAEFVGQIFLRRKLPNGNSKIDETIHVLLSAPSSGAQVYAVRRSLSYGNNAQTKIAQFLAALKDKMGGAQAQPIDPSGSAYRYQFDNGRLVALNPPTPDGQCAVGVVGSETRSFLKSINASGVCDVSLVARFGFGISREHASSAEFYLSDQERAKANKETDYAFVESYVRGLQSHSGAAPKL